MKAQLLFMDLNYLKIVFLIFKLDNTEIVKTKIKSDHGGKNFIFTDTIATDC